MRKNKELLSIGVVIFVDLLGFSIILPLLPYYAATFKATPQMVGLLVASFSVCQFLAAPVLGSLSDRYGRRPVLIYSQLGSMAGFLLLAFARTLPMLFASRIIDGISGGNITTAQAYIADVTEPKDRAGAMAIIGIGFGLGFMIGPFLGGEMAQHYGFAAPAYLAAAFSLSSTLLTTFYLKEHRHKPDASAARGLAVYKRVFEYLQIGPVRVFLLVFLFFALPFALYVTMFSLFAETQLKFEAVDTGRFLAGVGLLSVVWQGVVVRRMVRAIGELPSLRIGLASVSVGMFALAHATSTHILMVVALFFSFGAAVTRPVISSLLTQVAPVNRKGAVLGVSASIDSFCRSVAPLLGGWIIGALHPTYLGYVGCAFALVGFVLALRARVSEEARSQERAVNQVVASR